MPFTTYNEDSNTDNEINEEDNDISKGGKSNGLDINSDTRSEEYDNDPISRYPCRHQKRKTVLHT